MLPKKPIIGNLSEAFIILMYVSESVEHNPSQTTTYERFCVFASTLDSL